MDDRFQIPAAECRSELIDRRSRFLATLAHTPDPGAARAFIARIGEEFADATHNCWAFVAGPPGSTAQVGASDAGEPQGTAGRPMLKVLLHSQVGEITAAVTRYFGGVKLGKGGLVRAYSGAVKQALEELETREKVLLVQRQVTIEYAAIEPFRRLAPGFECAIKEEQFAAQATFKVELPQDRDAAFCKALQELTNGQARY